MLLGNRPFQNGPGASLYVGTPTAADIRYRRNRCVQDSSLWYPVSTDTIEPGAATVPKCLRVGSAASPTDEIAYTLPAELEDATIAVQARTYANDYENETIYRPQVIVAASGEQDDAILGTATILGTEKLDGGGMRLRFAYAASRSGVQPLEFALVQTSGPGSLSDVVIIAVDRLHEIEVTGLADATAYGWRLEARSGAVSAVLGTVSFTADAAGPPGVTGAVAVPI